MHEVIRTFRAGPVDPLDLVDAGGCTPYDKYVQPTKVRMNQEQDVEAAEF